MHEFENTVSTAIYVEGLMFSFVPLPFCLLTLFASVYYIRRRYKLYQEIKRIPQEMLIVQSYKNYLENLKIKSIINNFIIVILVLEFVQNMSEVIYFLPDWLLVFTPENQTIVPFLIVLSNKIRISVFSIRYSVVPVLCLMMKYLWLVYRKYDYKYTLIRWTVYILLRTLLILFLCIISKNHFYSSDYYSVFKLLELMLNSFILFFDYIQFLYLSRKFYLHLKSREKEIRLFYFDKKAYLDSRYLRVHFQVATTLVAIAFFFYTLGYFFNLYSLVIFLDNFPIPLHIKYGINLFTSSMDIYVLQPSLILSKVLFTVNYLYIFVAVVYKSIRDKQKMENINSYIKPIMTKYHKSIYNRH